MRFGLEVSSELKIGLETSERLRPWAAVTLGLEAGVAGGGGGDGDGGED